LTDFEQSKNDFAFRFRNYGQVVEIMKDSTSFSGTITNYVYYRKKRGVDSKTLFNKENISTEQAKQVYNLIKDTQILDLPSDKDINGWHNKVLMELFIYWSMLINQHIPLNIIGRQMVRKYPKLKS